MSVLEISGSVNESYDNMISRLQEKAQLIGADAVYIFDRNTVSTIQHDRVNEVTHSVFTGRHVPYYKSVNTSVLSAVGIKYIRNINYLSNYVKRIDILVYDSVGKWSEVKSSLFVDFEKNVDSLNGDRSYYSKFIRPYSTNHLLLEKSSRWKYSDPDETTLFRNYHDNDGYIEKSCSIILNDHKQPVSIEIKYNNKLKDRIEYEYESGVLVRRQLYLSNGFKYVEKYSYQDNNLKEIEIFNVVNDHEERYLLLDHIYYDNAEAILFK